MLNYLKFHLTFLSRYIIGLICLIFLKALLILNKFLLYLALRNFFWLQQLTRELLTTLFYKLYIKRMN